MAEWILAIIIDINVTNLINSLNDCIFQLYIYCATANEGDMYLMRVLDLNSFSDVSFKWQIILN